MKAAQQVMEVVTSFCAKNAPTSHHKIATIIFNNDDHDDHNDGGDDYDADDDHNDLILENIAAFF